MDPDTAKAEIKGVIDVIQCPVCRSDIPNSRLVVCERCGWDLETDVTLVISLHDIPEEVRKSYEMRVEIARRMWNERVQALERQKQLESRLKEREQLDQQREDELTHASARLKELERRLEEQEAQNRQAESERSFIERCRESDDPVDCYSEYLRRYPDGVCRAEAEGAIRETGGKGQPPATSRVLKKGKKGGNRSNSEARRPTILTPNGVFQHPAREVLQAYCECCEKEREMRYPKSILMEDGKPATRGVCPTCGTRIFRINWPGK